MIKKPYSLLIHLLIILILIFSSVYSVNSQVLDTNQLQYTICFDTPWIKNIRAQNQTMNIIGLNNTQKITSPGKPVLPVKPLQILLPYKTSIASVDVTVKQTRLSIHNLKQIQLHPPSQSFTTSILPTIASITPQFNKNIFYPEKTYETIGMQTSHGYNILYINIYPIQILQNQNLLRNHQEIIITLTTTPISDAPAFKPDYDIQQDILQHIINPEILETYKQETQSFHHNNQPIDYLLITTEALKNLSDPLTYTFDDLITQRESQGLTCAIETIEDIQNQYTGVDTQEQIRNCIKEYYTNHGTQWVLLGGDDEYVPARYLKSIDGIEHDEDIVTSDLYYQCLDGNYNYDGDYYWGEEYDGEYSNRIDLLAEVYVGRAPVDDSIDINAFVEKTLSYEQQSWDDSWTHRILSVGQELWNGHGGYGAGYVERCIDFCTDYDHETYGIPSAQYDIIELYERDGDWNEDDVITEVDLGVNIINHVGHGNPIAAMKFSIFELDLFSNTDKYGLFYSQACHSGQFEYSDDCFAERWVNIPQKGGFAAIMNTGYGYGSTMDYDGPDNRYAREFFDALFSPHEKISRIGKAHQDAKEDNIWRINENNMYHLYYCKTLFGDPYVSIIGSESVSAEFTWDPSYPVTGGVIDFQDQSKGMISYRHWDFGDGHISQQINPIHVYSAEGSYTVTLTVQDQFGYLSTQSQVIQVKDYWNPQAIITPGYYQGGNFTVYFSGSESWDPDGSITSYYWNFDDGETDEGINVIHTFQSEGTFNVELTVTDNHGNVAKNTSKIILLQQNPPEPPVIIQLPTLVDTGEVFELHVQTMDAESDQIQYGVRWEEDTSVRWSDEWYDSNESCIFTHFFATIGEKQVSIKARDIHYAESNWSQPISIFVEDTTNPSLQIISPVNGIYINDAQIIPFITPVIFGPITIQIEASDESGIEKVLFYIDDMIHPKAEVLSAPYQFTWNDPLFLKHVVSIKVYDQSGRTQEETIEVWKFF